MSWAGIRLNSYRRAEAGRCADVINDNWIEWICTTSCPMTTGSNEPVQPLVNDNRTEWTCTTSCPMTTGPNERVELLVNDNRIE